MKKRIIALFLVFCLLIPAAGVFAEENVDLEKIDQIINYVESHYNGDVSREDLINGVYKGILDTLDKHSKYYTEDEYKAFFETLDGSLIGIGIYIEEENKRIKVISPIEGSPAFKAGLKSGDLITHVDGQDVTEISFEEAIDMIKGKENTQVTIQILRAGKVLNFSIVREIIVIPDVTFRMIDDEIAYLRIIQFGMGSALEVDKAIAALKELGMTSIVVDLRNNPGGYLHEVKEIADWFVDKGDNIYYVDYKSSLDEIVNASKQALNIPTMVLVNGGSASASEILAGAIKYNNEGTIIGQTTYGKGTVQNLIKLEDKSGLKLTIAEYFSANNTKVNGVGIEPDITVVNPNATDIESSKDFAPMIDLELAHFGTTSLNVYGAQQRLKFLGFDLDVTAKYDHKTARAVEQFQTEQKLDEKYALYPETLKALNEAVAGYQVEDPQLSKAIEMIKSKE